MLVRMYGCPLDGGSYVKYVNYANYVNCVIYVKVYIMKSDVTNELLHSLYSVLCKHVPSV